MIIEYQIFGESALRFSPSLADRTDMIAVLRFLKSRKTDDMSVATLMYFIEKLNEELTSEVQ